MISSKEVCMLQYIRQSLIKRWKQIRLNSGSPHGGMKFAVFPDLTECLPGNDSSGCMTDFTHFLY